MADIASGIDEGGGEVVSPPASERSRDADAKANTDEDDEGVTDVDRKPLVDDLRIVDDLRVVDDLERVRLFGLDLVNAPCMKPVVDQILDGVRRDDDEVEPVLLTPNVDIVVHFYQNPAGPESRLLRRAQYCLPDGQPLVMVSGRVGTPLKARLPGSGLFAELWPRIVERDMPVAVVASSVKVGDMLRAEHEGADVVVPPIFDADDEAAVDQIVDQVLASAEVRRPELVLVGIGFPKDAHIINALFDRWPEHLGPKPLCLGLGASFALYLGLRRRAPSWIQELGMEWFYRFLQEPRRLFHRYFIRDVAFIGIVRNELRRSDARPS